ncbi:hypothetical protein IEQ34_020240 [Dendrobium chrysotoxum]|uniref:Uncharacterized protein n=1 Tax=Dendrobium chrysotoxum TaxID=161865 RepID=A0AAV7G1D2_DENCH|nr:hypothetical protein IEQ34_020240 [Dendrobium chrysotoxum]
MEFVGGRTGVRRYLVAGRKSGVTWWPGESPAVVEEESGGVSLAAKRSSPRILMNECLFFQEGDNAVQQQPDRVAQCHCLPAFSICIFGAGIWLKTGSSTDFEKLLDQPVIVLGVYLVVVSLAGLVSGRCLVSRLIYKGTGEVVSCRGYRYCLLGEFSN